MNRQIAILGFIIGAAGLALQFAITIPASMSAGRSAILSIVYYFSFFTILTNLGLVLIYAAKIFATPQLNLFRKPITRATAAGAIALVMGFYHFVLAGIWAPEGLFLICDITLHYIAPIIYLLWFATWARSGTLTFNTIPKMLLAPVIYLAYVMARGALVGEYPYPVLEANRIGYGAVATNVVGILIILIILFSAAITIDRFRPQN